MTTGNDDTIQTARDLTGALRNVAQRLEEVKQASEDRDTDLAAANAAVARYERRNRVLVTVDILLTFVVAFFGWLAHDASNTATQTRQATIISCQQTNTARAENEQLWAYTLTLFGPRPGETAAQKAAGQVVLTRLRKRVDTTFAPRDCQALLNGRK